MGLGPLLARVAAVTGAVSLLAGSLLVGQLAFADGREGRRAQPPRPPQQAYVPVSPDIPSLLGGTPDPCLSSEGSYRAISEATQGADIAAINGALDEVNLDPTGALSGSNASPLAVQLRIALGLSASAQPCETVLAALQDSVQLAQLASVVEPEGPVTGAIGEPPPTSPSYRIVRSGPPGGAGGHGYCVHVTNHCRPPHPNT